jgi:hypothetical protein
VPERLEPLPPRGLRRRATPATIAADDGVLEGERHFLKVSGR